jgi:hypothetical protein
MTSEPSNTRRPHPGGSQPRRNRGLASATLALAVALTTACGSRPDPCKGGDEFERWRDAYGAELEAAEHALANVETRVQQLELRLRQLTAMAAPAAAATATSGSGKPIGTTQVAAGNHEAGGEPADGTRPPSRIVGYSPSPEARPIRISGLAATGEVWSNQGPGSGAVVPQGTGTIVNPVPPPLPPTPMPTTPAMDLSIIVPLLPPPVVLMVPMMMVVL